MIEVGYEFSVYTTTEEEESITLIVVVRNFPNGTPRAFTLLASTNNGSAGMIHSEVCVREIEGERERD